MIDLPIERLVRFMEPRIEPDLNTGCWLWSGNTTGFGYGVMGVRQNNKVRNVLMHRAAWLIYTGQDPGELHVLHRCDTPACVNPDHLFLGTAGDNVRDAIAKGRLVHRGSANGSAVLNDDQVRAIRQDHRTLDEVANDYGCGRSTIWRVRRGDVYANVA